MSWPSSDTALGQLMARFPRPGTVEWIGVRPARDVSMIEADEVLAVVGKGLVGDRYKGGSGKRELTVIQAEHLPVIATLAGLGSVQPATLRRNLVVSAIPVIAFKGRRFRIGDVVLEGTSPCDPCSRMENALGPGGYNAMRGMGGLCVRIIEGGVIRRGDAVVALD